MSVRFLITSIAFAVLAGCASTPPTPVYNPSDSKALNIMKAAGMYAELKDVEVPKDTITSITDSKGYGFAMAASGYTTPIPGFSATQMAGLNFAAWLLAPTADTARNSFFAWMPENEAGNNPRDRMADLLLDAASKAATELGYTPKQFISNSGQDKSGISVTLTNGPGPACKEAAGDASCWIGFAIRKPVMRHDEKSFVSETNDTWFFDPSASVYSRFAFPEKNNGLNELDLLARTSKYLPPWVYFYVAPNKIRLNQKDTVKVPVLINSGNVLYFVKVKS